MPGDLSDPESSPSTGHYDPRYDPGTSALESRPLNVDQILQAVSREICDCSLDKEGLGKAYRYLAEKKLLNRNPGDQEVQDAVREYMNKIRSARKVAQRCLI